MSTTEEIIYDAALRAVERQEKSLDEIRSRAGLLLGAASIAASFLGTRALEHEKNIGVAGQVAIWSFGGVAAVMIVLVVPWRGWSFGLTPWKLLRAQTTRPLPPDRAQLAMAEALMESHIANAKKLKLFYIGLALGALLLAVEVVTWLFELRR